MPWWLATMWIWVMILFVAALWSCSQSIDLHNPH